MRESISFARLNDDTWGIRVATKGQHPSPGDTIPVTTRAGKTSEITLGQIVDRDRGAFPGPAVYFRIQGKNQPKARQPRNQDPEYLRGYHEVAQIQAMSAPGSALREQMYLDMEMAAYNRGED